ncbi:TonB-dependent receptor [Paraglaciecola aquimarina]|uniref:TonB-dependent receptor n=1 Tax=Paraglaciecola algarum TaxID=3050085 RepID=A0ABS9D6E1_9ALTE|nr:TonB-dependent receptor [Paraglaciecola sp. G1-23]MCF2948498.1 TonB-dependent receptor [Paraglaciecola sp. G1-23]
MPGVLYAGGDDGGGPAVRGSSPQDNAFFIDGMPAGYIYHLFGDSVFNKNIVQDFNFQASSFGAQYGEATGGIFDVKLRDPRQQDIKFTLDASLTKTGIFAEGSIAKDQAFYASYRRSLIHLFLKEGSDEEGITITDAPISDDYQTKYQWQIGSNQKLTISALGASDEAGADISSLSEEGRIQPDLIGNARVKTSANSQSIFYEYFGNKTYSSIGINQLVTEDRSSFGAGQFTDGKNTQSNLRASVTSNIVPNHTITFGLDAQRNSFDYAYDIINYTCTEITPDCESQRGERVQGSDEIEIDVIGAYLIDSWYLSKTVMVEIGTRFEKDSYTDESFVHPRISLAWMLNNSSTVFAKGGVYSRFPDGEQALPTLGNPDLKPFLANHYSAGVENDWNALWSSKFEIYYKQLEDLPRATDDLSPNPSLNYTNDVSGESYGAELLVERQKQNGWYAWASFSYSKSERTDELSKQTTPYRLDTPWVLNMVANYEYSDDWEFGARFTARAGARYTPIDSLRVNPDFPDNFLPNYGELNSEILPDYVRLDLQAKYSRLPYGLDGAVTFALLNALGGDNVSGYYYLPDGTESLTNVPIEAEKGLEVFPSIGIELSF